MIESISRPMLPKGLRYVLTTTQLEQALAAAGIDCHVDLNYWTPQGGGSILEGHYWLPNDNIPYPRVYVRAGCVPSDLQPLAASALRRTALPRFLDWLQRILSLPDNSPALFAKPYFNATFTGQDVQITYEPQYKVPRRRK